MISVESAGLSTNSLVVGADPYSTLFVDANRKLQTDPDYTFDETSARRLFIKTNNVNQSAAVYDSISGQATDLVQFNIDGSLESRINADGQYQGNRVSVTYIREPNDGLNAVQFVAGSRRVIFLGGIYPGGISDGSAANSTLFDSSTSGKLSWKDSGGTVHVLY